MTQKSFYSQSLDRIASLSAKKAALLAKETGCATIEELLYYFPRRYLDRSLSEKPLLQTGKEATLILRISSVYLSHSRFSRLIAHAHSLDGAAIKLIWFRGTHYFRRIIRKNTSLIVSGKLDYYQGLQMTHPDFEVLEGDVEGADFTHTGRIIPLYPSKEGLKKAGLDSRGIRRILAAILKQGKDSPIEEILPKVLVDKHKLMERHKALEAMHFPEEESQKEAAVYRLKYEELYAFQILMKQKSLFRSRIERKIMPVSWSKCSAYERLVSTLPFSLTADQQNAIRSMLEKITSSTHPQAFLLQGDVGSGKTLVALALCLHYVEADYQTAFLAPTEVLARQHFLKLSDFLGLEKSYQLALLLGSDTKKERKESAERVASGDASIVIGTHALIENSLVFQRLALVVIDEQHRFGVKQRDAMLSKGIYPDTLAMSATPIPRSLCLTEFSDLELVSLRHKPAGRKAIQTMRLRPSQRSAMYKSIRNHVSKGRQCYIVYPLIEESEKMDLQAASQAHADLSENIFPDFVVALLHGKMKKKEQEGVMEAFQKKRVQILVTTSIIEVGVDVPNATIMVIENAERFGISQLHQLRGRVGRGDAQSYCVLMSEARAQESRGRLQALLESQDGFYLAEVDLKIRGTGEILGFKQHGLSELRLADIVKDKAIVEKTHADSLLYAELPSNLQTFLCRRFAEGISVFPH